MRLIPPKVLLLWNEGQLLDITLNSDIFYVLLTLHPCIISYINPTRCTILLNIFIYYSSLHVSGIHVPIIRRKLLCLCDTRICNSVWVASGVIGVRGGAAGWGTALQAGRLPVRFPMASFEFFHWRNPSGRTMALWLTQSLTEMSTRNISWSKGGRCVGLTTLPRSCAECLDIWEPKPPGTLRAWKGL